VRTNPEILKPRVSWIKGVPAVDLKLDALREPLQHIDAASESQ
jgi:hypothetical protein